MNKLLSYLLLTAILPIATAYSEENQLLKLGMLLPLSGSYSAIGEDCRQGIELALAESNPSPSFSFIYSDSKADPHTGVTEFKNLVDHHKVIAAYIIRGPVGMAVNPISQSAKIPLLGGVANYEFVEGNSYAFQLWAGADEEALFMAEAMASKGLRKIAMISAEDDYPMALARDFDKAAQKIGLEIIFRQNVAPTETDFRTMIAQLKVKKPDALFINLGLAQIAPALKQLNQQKVETARFSNFFAAKSKVIENAGKEASDGVVFVELSTDFPKMSALLKDKFHSTPSGATVSGYVATMLLVKVAEQLPSSASSEQFYQKLLEQTEVRTQNGVFPIAQRKVKFPLRLRQIKDGQLVTAGNR